MFLQRSSGNGYREVAGCSYRLQDPKIIRQLEPPEIEALAAMRMAETVVVLGANISGLSCALQLKRIDPNARVIVMDKRDPFQSEGHGINMGHVGALPVAEQRIFDYCEDDVGRNIIQAIGSGDDQVKAFITSTREGTISTWNHYIHIGTNGERSVMKNKILGFRLSEFTAGLAAAAQSAGVMIYKDSFAEELTRVRGGWVVVTEACAIHARHVVVTDRDSFSLSTNSRPRLRWDKALTNLHETAITVALHGQNREAAIREIIPQELRDAKEDWHYAQFANDCGDYGLIWRHGAIDFAARPSPFRVVPLTAVVRRFHECFPQFEDICKSKSTEATACGKSMKSTRALSLLPCVSVDGGNITIAGVRPHDTGLAFMLGMEAASLVRSKHSGADRDKTILEQLASIDHGAIGYEWLRKLAMSGSLKQNALAMRLG